MAAELNPMDSLKRSLSKAARDLMVQACVAAVLGALALLGDATVLNAALSEAPPHVKGLAVAAIVYVARAAQDQIKHRFLKPMVPPPEPPVDYPRAA